MSWQWLLVFVSTRRREVVARLFLHGPRVLVCVRCCSLPLPLIVLLCQFYCGRWIYRVYVGVVPLSVVRAVLLQPVGLPKLTKISLAYLRDVMILIVDRAISTGVHCSLRDWVVLEIVSVESLVALDAI